MPELIPINVFISGRSYRIRIPAEEEAKVRQATKAADEKIAELRRHYAGRDDQDFIAMCLLMYATDNTTRLPDQFLRDEIISIEEKINKVLSSQS